MRIRNENDQNRLEEEQQHPEGERLHRTSGRWSCYPDTGFVLSDGLVRAIFLLLGVGILIPWNAFVSAKPYFSSRLCQSGHDVVNFEQWFGLVWNLSSVISLALCIAGQYFSDYLKKKRENDQSLPSNIGRVNAADPTQNGEFLDQLVQLTSDRANQSETISRIIDDDDRSSSSSAFSDSSLEHGKINSFFNVIVPLGLYAVVFSIQALLVTVPDISPRNFLTITLIGLALCGTCGAIATAGIVSTAGFFPPHIGINPFFSGQALGGAAVSVANFAAIAIGEDPNDYYKQHCRSSTNDVEESIPFSSVSSSTTRRLVINGVNSSCSPYHNLDWAVFSYFLAGCFVLLLCLLGFMKVHQYKKNRFHHIYETHDHQSAQHETNSSTLSFNEVDDSPRIGLELNDRIHQRQEIIAVENNNANLLRTRSDQEISTLDHDELVSESLFANTSDSRCTAISVMEVEEQSPNASNLLNTYEIDVEHDENANYQTQRDTFDDERQENADSDSPNSILLIIKGPATCIFLTFAITLSLFPSWISELKSSHECENRFRLANDLYVPFSFVFFNIGDLLGRLISGYIQVNRIRHLSRKLVLCAMLRVLFLPIFLMCNSTLGSENNIVIRNDFFSLSVQLLFAVSNGVLVSTSFMWSPRLVGATSGLQERASEVMTLSLSFGLLSGSFLAFPFLQFASHLLK